jgi:hypothetical protein
MPYNVYLLCRHILVLVSYAWGQSGANSQPASGYFKEVLPLTPSPDGPPVEDELILAPGMTVGLFYTVYELPDESDLVHDTLTQPPLLALNPPDDVLKVRQVIYSSSYLNHKSVINMSMINL